MKSNKKIMFILIFTVLYGLFTAMCLLADIKFPEHRHLIFLIWYTSSTKILIVSAIILALLLAEILKTNKSRNELKKTKDNKNYLNEN